MPIQVKLQYNTNEESSEQQQSNNPSTLEQKKDATERSLKLSRFMPFADTNRQISKTDISASSRLNGYIYCFLAYLVQMMSVVQFMRVNGLRTDFYTQDLLKQSESSDTAYYLYPYKICATVVLGSFLAIVFFLVSLVHFDTMVCPTFWRKVFADGSKIERNLIFCWILLGIANEWFSNTLFGIGQYQSNVFFSCWIGVIAIVYNYDQWRIGAGMQSIYSIVNEHPQATLQSWCLIAFFSTMSTANATFIYFEGKQNLELLKSIHYQIWGIHIEVRDNPWIPAIIGAGGTAIIAAFAITINMRLRSNVLFQFWRCLEGNILFILLVVWSSATTTYTSRRSFLSRPCNEYFAIWGAFLSCMSGFGNWITVVSRSTFANNEDQS